MRCFGEALALCAGLTLSCGKLPRDYEPSPGTGGAPTLDGTCVDSAEPVRLVADTSDYPPAAEFVAVDASHVYFTEPLRGVVARVGLCGGVVEELATKRSGPFQIALDADFVFWTEGGTTPFDGKLVRKDKKGGPFFEVFSDLYNPSGLAVDSSSVFYSGAGTWRWDKYGGLAPTLIAESSGFANLALDEDFVYFATARAPKQGGPLEVLSSTENLVWCSAVDEQWLYWTEYYDGGVWKVPKAGGAATQLLPVGPWRCLAAGGGYVYAASDDGMYRVASDGAGAQKIGGPGMGVALDATFVYWAGKGGIWRAPR